jgi:DNA-binding XRE family transcriptional regulator
MSEKLWQSSPNFKLIEQRKQRRWTQVEVAEALGVIDLTVR